MHCPIIFIAAISFLLTYRTLFSQENTPSPPAAPAKSFSLKEAQDYAIKNGYGVKNAAFDVDASKWKIRETTAMGLPQVNGTFGYQYFIKQQVSLIPAEVFGGPSGTYKELVFGTKQNARADLTATQLIFDGAYFVGLQASQVYADLSAEKLSKAELDVKEHIAKSYYTILVAEENVKILQQNKKNLDKTLAETTALFQNGFVEEQNVEQLQLLSSNITNAINQARRQVELAHDMLRFQMGLDIKEKIVLKDNLSGLMGNPADENMLSSKPEVGSLPDYKLAGKQEQLMFLNHKLERTKHLPRLNGFMSYSQNAFRNEFNFFSGNEKWFPLTLWGINLQVPIFSSYMLGSRVKQAVFDLEKSKVMKIQVEQALRLQIQNSRSGYMTAIDRNNSEKNNLALAEKIRNKTLIKYNEGVATSMELTQAENQYVTTQGNYINSIFQVLNARVELEKATGNLK